MKKFKLKAIKVAKDCLIIFWASILAMILISAIEGFSNHPELISDNSIIYKQSIYEFSAQDTTKKVVKPVKVKELTKKEKELESYTKRKTKMELDMKKMEEQSILLDSLLKKK